MDLRKRHKNHGRSLAWPNKFLAKNFSFEEVRTKPKTVDDVCSVVRKLCDADVPPQLYVPAQQAAEGPRKIVADHRNQAGQIFEPFRKGEAGAPADIAEKTENRQVRRPTTLQNKKDPIRIGERTFFSFDERKISVTQLCVKQFLGEFSVGTKLLKNTRSWLWALFIVHSKWSHSS